MKVNSFLKFIICIIITNTYFSFESKAKNTKNIKNVIIATGGITGVYYPAGGAICRLVNRSRFENGIHCYVESTEGSIANLNALRNGKFDLAIAQSDWLHHAYKGTGRFSDQRPFKDLRLVMSLHTETFILAVRESSGINKIDDMVGKRVNFGSSDSGMYSTMKVLMDIKGWKKSDFKSTTSLSPSNQIESLCNKKIDVMTYIAGNPNGIIQEATRHQGSKCKVKILSIDKKTIEKLVSRFPFYTKAKIPGGLYNNNKKDISTFGIKAVLLSTNKVDPQTIESLLEAVVGNLDSLKSLHPVLSNFKESEILPISKDQQYPVHKGSLNYIKNRRDILGEIKYTKLEARYKKLKNNHNNLQKKYKNLKTRYKKLLGAEKK
jgi:TRAP transporter TAXI family solute receptor